MLVRQLGRLFHRLDHSEEVRRLNDHGGHIAAQLRFEAVEGNGSGLEVVIELFHGHPLMLRVGSQHVAVFGMHGARYEDAASACHPHGHHGGFRDSRGAVVHRSVRHFHAGQLTDHRLKFKDGGQRSLGDLSLIRCVRRQELAARDHSVDEHGAIVVVHARAEKRGVSRRCFGPEAAEVFDDFVFRLAGLQIQRTVETGIVRKMREQLIGARQPARLQHRAALGIRLGEVTQEI
jgi:hypothetical protein